jgi:hypothetical protein
MPLASRYSVSPSTLVTLTGPALTVAVLAGALAAKARPGDRMPALSMRAVRSFK